MKADSSFFTGIQLSAFFFCTFLLDGCISIDSQQWSNLTIRQRTRLKRINQNLDKIRYLISIRDQENVLWRPFLPNDSIPEDVWNTGGNVKLLIHGYTFKESQTSDERIGEQGIFDLGIAYSMHDKSTNVVVVDWTVLSTEPLHRYFEASRATKYVGYAVAEFLMRLRKVGLITNWDQVHIVGFSLGAHTVGAVGAKVQELEDGALIGRITGLDPAGPGFDIHGKVPDDLSNVLDKSDGKFVDIIHCNMRVPGQSVFGHLGSCIQAGHADFYPDGGESQEPCTSVADKSDVPCSHMKCTEYMKKSLETKYLTCPCENWETYKAGQCNCSEDNGGQYMGDPCNNSASGKYFILIKQQ